MMRAFHSTFAACFFALLAAALLPFILVAHAREAAQDVIVIDQPRPTANDGTIEVLEFFGYGCIHCAHLEPAMEAWAKKLPADVRFRRVPAGFGSSGVDDIPLFHTLEAMGQLERLHQKIFDAIFNEQVMIAHRLTMLKWLEKNGVDPARYESIERSFSVQSKITRGRGLAAYYNVSATPMMVVNGRYVVRRVGSSNIFDTVDRLIAEERAAAKAAAARQPQVGK